MKSSPIGSIRLYLVLTLLMVAAMSSAIYCYSNLFSERSFLALVGTQEDYASSTAQFETRLADFELLLYRKDWGCLSECKDLKSEFDILESKFFVLSNRSESTRLLYAEQGYDERIERIRTLFADVGRIMELPGMTQKSLTEVAEKIRLIRIEALNLSALAAHAEAKQRDRTYRIFLKNRTIILIGVSIIISSVAIIGFITIFNIQQSRKTIRQQAQALAAERRATAAASEAVRAKNAFLGAIGHELRTPLQSITSAIDVISGARIALEHTDTIKRLELAAMQIESQMRDLTDYARLDSGKLELRNSDFRLAPIVTATATEAVSLIGRKPVRLICENHGIDDVCLHSDAARIRQIMTNLLSNAIKNTRAGSVKLSCELAPGAQGGRLRLRVEDTGTGIPADKLDHIFHPFTQIDHGQTNIHDGAGMGLSIVKGLVDLFGGGIGVRSEVGKGSVFTVDLPVRISRVAAGPGAGGDDPAQAEDGGVFSTPHHVLVVDDNKSALSSFSSLLEQIGCTCEPCDSAERAMQKLMRRPYDVLLLDLHMPERDGISVAKELRLTRGPNYRIPVVGVSAHAPELLTEEQMALFDDYLMKPVRREILFRTLKRLVSVSG
ncbi:MULTISPECIES: hybrid sensor histidine kinase/response regulator [Burkholderia]|uniref:Virulence sensor protein BvgS n=2 Tax=Burkholderia humptydooensis TaxID=430531 RepID=A0A7U4P3X3_9BURK|nr:MULTISPECIES: hybrid sensor histidine kinase/response regulator [Burkholderia]AGK48594.1 response regulator [Burkholderia thailandensis MSMB121]ATF36862.1 hybrid sensor histidine kinase/response regulator [Burkholderia thailandensis]AJY41929.1 response regulator [Burkholderia sp. 2002721687]ALX42532.1 hybrid sensor histidine kinase/response regulator [Burkholderia humptydooensis]EIP87922.1 integral membrane sensor hybrid histidine kinase [Burkholderia humptydooensis MSMB43]